jgi:hypothetical protein
VIVIAAIIGTLAGALTFATYNWWMTARLAAISSAHWAERYRLARIDAEQWEAVARVAKAANDGDIQAMFRALHQCSLVGIEVADVPPRPAVNSKGGEA